MTDSPHRLMPKAVDLGRAASTTLDMPFHQWGEALENADIENPTGGPTIMGYAIPTWQRPLVWDESQMIKFVESVWKGLPLGTYTINRAGYKSPLDNLLIDGQQRLTAIQWYAEDRFPVMGYRWSEVTKVDHRFFKSTSFASYITESEDEEYLKDYYNLMNFGGTVHTEDQRA